MSSIPGDKQFLNDLGKFLSQVMILIKAKKSRINVFLARIQDGKLRIGYNCGYSYCTGYYGANSDKTGYPNCMWPELYDYVQNHTYLIDELKKYVDTDYPQPRRRVINIFYQSGPNRVNETFAIGPVKMRSSGMLDLCYYSKFTPLKTHTYFPSDQWH